MTSSLHKFQVLIRYAVVVNLENLSSHFVYHCNTICIILHHPSIIRMPECRLIQALQLKHATRLIDVFLPNSSMNTFASIIVR